MNTPTNSEALPLMTCSPELRHALSAVDYQMALDDLDRVKTHLQAGNFARAAVNADCVAGLCRILERQESSFRENA